MSASGIIAIGFALWATWWPKLPPGPKVRTLWPKRIPEGQNVNPVTKISSRGSKVRTLWSELSPEDQKCEPVCQNCLQRTKIIIQVAATECICPKLSKNCIWVCSGRWSKNCSKIIGYIKESD